MSVVLTGSGARKLKQIVAKVDAIKQDRSGQKNGTGAAEDSMWGFITGCDRSGRPYNFVRVMPGTDADDADIRVDGSTLRFQIFDGDPARTAYTAYEANEKRGIRTGKVVRMTLAGFRDDDGVPQPT